MLPIPDEGNPILKLSFVHLYSVDGTIEPEKLMADIIPFPQLTISLTGLIEGAGFTSILKDFEGPVQPLVNGVTVTKLLTGILLEFKVVKAGILPVPEIAESPVFTLVCTQLYRVF
jgi:hypothetical protein